MLKISILALLLSSVAQAQSVQPGQWQTETIFEVNGISLPSSKAEECISAADAKDLKATLTKELTKQGCTVNKWTLKGQKVDIALACKKSGLDATGNLQGTVTAKSYDLKGEAGGTYQSIPSEAVIVLKGKWLKDCKK